MAILSVAAAGMVSSGCAGGGTSVTPGTEAHVTPYTYVAIGGNESVGFDANDPVRQAFPVLLDRRLPKQTVFYDLAVPEATAADVLTYQEAAALALRPNLVTIWVGLSDLEAGVSPTQFGSELQKIVTPLRTLHAQVLLANIEPITDAPAYEACAGVQGSPPNWVPAVSSTTASPVIRFPLPRSPTPPSPRTTHKLQRSLCGTVPSW